MKKNRRNDHYRLENSVVADLTPKKRHWKKLIVALEKKVLDDRFKLS